MRLGVSGALDQFLIRRLFHLGNREGPDLFVLERERKHFGDEIDSDDLKDGGLGVFVGVEEIAAHIGLLGGADVFVEAEDDVVVAVPDEGDANGRAADFFVVEGDDGAFGVAAEGDFAFDAAGEEGGAEGGEEEEGTEGGWGVDHGADCNAGVWRLP